MIRLLNAKSRPTPLGVMVLMAVAAVSPGFRAWAILPAYVVRTEFESYWETGGLLGVSWWWRALNHSLFPLVPGEILRSDDGGLTLMTAVGAAILLGLVHVMRTHPIRRIRSIARYRPTLLGVMVLVAVAAVTLKFYTWAVLPAFMVRSRLGPPLNDVLSDEYREPFWPLYWRQVRGIPKPPYEELTPQSDDGGLILMTAVGTAVLFGLIYAIRKHLVRRI